MANAKWNPFGGYRFIGESPRWLLTQGRTKEACKEVRRAAKVNKVEYPSDLMPTPTETPVEVSSQLPPRG